MSAAFVLWLCTRQRSFQSVRLHILLEESFMSKIVLAVFPQGGATFASFDGKRFDEHVAKPLRALLADGSPVGIARAIIFPRGEEEKPEDRREEESPPHMVTPTYVATRQFFTPHFGDRVEVSLVMNHPATFERNAAGYVWGTGATGMISWFVDETVLNPDEVSIHVMHHRASCSRLVTRLGIPLSVPVTA